MKCVHNIRVRWSRGRTWQASLAALLTVLLVPFTARSQNTAGADDDVGLELRIFLPFESVARSRRDLERVLADRIRDVDRECHLTERQRDKLSLMGEGDISRFFTHIQDAKAVLRVVDTTRFQDDAEFRKAAAPFQVVVRSGFFLQNSLFNRSLQQVLSPSQFRQWREAVRARQAPHKRKMVQKLVEFLDSYAHLGTGKWQVFADHLEKEVASFENAGPFLLAYLGIRANRLCLAGKMEFLSNEQKRVLRVVGQMFEEEERILRAAHYLPDEDAEDPLPPLETEQHRTR
jgi:hypothetical protein